MSSADVSVPVVVGEETFVPKRVTTEATVVVGTKHMPFADDRTSFTIDVLVGSIIQQNPSLREVLRKVFEHRRSFNFRAGFGTQGPSWKAVREAQEQDPEFEDFALRIDIDAWDLTAPLPRSFNRQQACGSASPNDDEDPIA